MSQLHDEPIESLQAHVAWVRRLAHRLVADAQAAEDLAQETWVAALQSGVPRELTSAQSRGSLRAFLAGVLRRRVLQFGRNEGNRRGRELASHAGIPPEGTPAPEEALEQAESGQRLSSLVFELEEPFRDVILLRYYSELSPRDIAHRLSIPIKTVESRLSRGRARLRERWERSAAADGKDGLSALALLAWPGAGFPPPVPQSVSTGGGPSSALSELAPVASHFALPSWGVFFVNTKLALIALFVAGGAGILWLAGRDASPPSNGMEPESARLGASAALAPAESIVVVEPTENDATPAQRTGVPASADSSNEKDVVEPAAASAALEHRFFGMVVDPNERPLADVTVAFEPSSGGGERVLTTSAGDGRFELVTASASGRVHAVDEELENLFVFHAQLTASREMLLVLAPHRRLAGRVRDANGNALGGVPVAFELPHGFRTRFASVLDGANDARWEAVTDAEGRFVIEDAPVVEESRVTARLDGYPLAWVEAPSVERDDLVLVLDRALPAEGVLLGRVVDAAGVPAANALVSLGQGSTVTALDGTFQLSSGSADEDDMDPARLPDRLRAVREGSLPGEFTARRDALSGAPQWPEWIEVQLGDEPLELAGVVVDAEGNPRPHVKLWVADPTVFGVIGDDLTAQLENLAAPEENTYEEGSDAYFRPTFTDEEGRFRLQGLLARDYRIGLLDRETFARLEVGPFSAGRSDLRVELVTPELRSIHGRVVSRKGLAVEGAQVILHAHLFGGVHESGGREISDAEGRFSFEGVAPGALSVWVRGDRVAPSMHGLDGETQEVELVVDALCHIRLEAESLAKDVDGLHVLDSGGERLAVYQISANGSFTWYSAPIVAGKTSSLGVPEQAATAVLTQGGREVERIPIFPRLGELYVVRP